MPKVSWKHAASTAPTTSRWWTRMYTLVASRCFNKYRQIVFQNPKSTGNKRAEIFSSLILSRLLYGSDSWCLAEQKPKDYLHGAIIRLYRRLLKVGHTEHLTDAEIIHRAGLPEPTVLLRVRRPGYLGSLLSVGDSAHWCILNQDSYWINLLRDDFLCHWEQLRNSCHLGHPEEHKENGRTLNTYS